MMLWLALDRKLAGNLLLALARKIRRREEERADRREPRPAAATDREHPTDTSSQNGDRDV